MPTIALKRPHPGQVQVLKEAKRFSVLKCGRRWGKTILTESLSIKPALDGKLVGYWSPTYKDMNKVWDSIKYILYPVISSKDEQLKQVKLTTGGQIDFWSLEDPNNGRGFSYHRVIIDECEKARNFEAAWKNAIRPTLTDYIGDAWFMSTPKFGKTYFKEISQYKEKYSNWNSWTKTTYDNPFLSKAEIDEAKSQLDNLTFRCEYLAEDVDITANPFAYAFEAAKHVSDCTYSPGAYLMLSFDFNVDPITAIAAQEIDGQVRVINEFRLENSNIYELCDRISATFHNPVYLVTGDATGHNRSALAAGNINYYTVIKQKLNLSDGQLKNPSVNPSVGDSRVLTNSILQNKPTIISPSCTYLIEDLKYVEVDDTGDIDKKKDKHKSHLLDCFRYLLSTFYGNFIRHYA